MVPLQSCYKNTTIGQDLRVIFIGINRPNTSQGQDTPPPPPPRYQVSLGMNCTKAKLDVVHHHQ